jgi:hypothetical protein
LKLIAFLLFALQYSAAMVSSSCLIVQSAWHSFSVVLHCYVSSDFVF